MKIKRLAPGEYVAGEGEYTVTISRSYWLPSSGPQWMVRADWDSSLYSDPLWYYSDAKEVAANMIANPHVDMMAPRS